MAESQYARDMRREAEVQTAIARQTYDAQLETNRQSMALAHETLNASNRAEELAAETLRGQRELIKKADAHNFAMWRQGTDNGALYNNWLKAVTPILDRFLASQQEWEEAKAADIAEREEILEKEALNRFDLRNQRSLRSVRITKRSHENIALSLLGLGAGWWLFTMGLAYVSSSLKLMDIDLAYAASGILGVAALALIACDVLFLTPVTKAYRRRSDNAVAWVKEQSEAYREQFPQNWASGTDWEQLDLIDNNIKAMPDCYMNFDPDWLLSIPTKLPNAMFPSDLPQEAQHSRGYLMKYGA